MMELVGNEPVSVWHMLKCAHFYSIIAFDTNINLLPHLPILRYSQPEVHLSNVSTVFPRSLPYVGLPGGDTQCPSGISYPADVPCPGPLPSSGVFNHVCDLCLFSYPVVCFSVPVCNV